MPDGSSKTRRKQRQPQQQKKGYQSFNPKHGGDQKQAPGARPPVDSANWRERWTHVPTQHQQHPKQNQHKKPNKTPIDNIREVAAALRSPIGRAATPKTTPSRPRRKASVSCPTSPAALPSHAEPQKSKGSKTPKPRKRTPKNKQPRAPKPADSDDEFTALPPSALVKYRLVAVGNEREPEPSAKPTASSPPKRERNLLTEARFAKGPDGSKGFALKRAIRARTFVICPRQNATKPVICPRQNATNPNEARKSIHSSVTTQLSALPLLQPRRVPAAGTPSLSWASLVSQPITIVDDTAVEPEVEQLAEALEQVVAPVDPEVPEGPNSQPSPTCSTLPSVTLTVSGASKLRATAKEFTLDTAVDGDTAGAVPLKDTTGNLRATAAEFVPAPHPPPGVPPPRITVLEHETMYYDTPYPAAYGKPPRQPPSNLEVNLANIESLIARVRRQQSARA